MKIDKRTVVVHDNFASETGETCTSTLITPITFQVRGIMPLDASHSGVK